MHDNEASRIEEKFAHLSKTYLVAGEDKNVEDDLSSEHSLHKRVIVILGSCKVFDVLPFT